jgi:hypothetical protein
MTDDQASYALYLPKIATSYGVDVWEAYDAPGAVISATSVWRSMDELNKNKGTDGEYRGRVGKYIRFMPAKG